MQLGTAWQFDSIVGCSGLECPSGSLSPCCLPVPCCQSPQAPPRAAPVHIVHEKLATFSLCYFLSERLSACLRVAACQAPLLHASTYTYDRGHSLAAPPSP